MVRPRTSIGDKASKSARRSASSSASKRRKSCFATDLHHIIDLARALTEAPADLSGATASGDSRTKEAAATAPNAAALELHQALGRLAPESGLKVCALLLAGQDGREIASVVTPTLDAEVSTWFSVEALSARGAKLADYLQRGYAIACATDIDVEAPIARWARTGPSNLEDRVWLSFGKQLANSDPSEWSCLSVTAGREKSEVTKLYLQRAGKAWWSFRRVLDRPSPAVVRQAQRGADRGGARGSTDASLQKVLTYSVGVEYQALQRAVRAIRARLGIMLEQAKA